MVPAAAAPAAEPKPKPNIATEAMKELAKEGIKAVCGEALKPSLKKLSASAKETLQKELGLKEDEADLIAELGEKALEKLIDKLLDKALDEGLDEALNVAKKLIDDAAKNGTIPEEKATDFDKLIKSIKDVDQPQPMLILSFDDFNLPKGKSKKVVAFC